MKNTESRTSILGIINTIYLIAIGLYIGYKIYKADFFAEDGNTPPELSEAEAIGQMETFAILICSYFILKSIEKVIEKLQE